MGIRAKSDVYELGINQPLINNLSKIVIAAEVIPRGTNSNPPTSQQVVTNNQLN